VAGVRILLLAPQPFYQVRGTPIAVDLMLRTLSARGDDVDVLVYHEGAPVAYPGVRVHRIPRLPGLGGIGPGPSMKKLCCDVPFFAQALRLAARRRYDLVHAVEESVFMAVVIRQLFGIPFVYDMDSSMSEQIAAKYPFIAWMGKWIRACEEHAIRNAEAVVPVCDALAEIAGRYQPRRLAVLRDISLLAVDPQSSPSDRSLKDELRIDGLTVMYIGNLEPYQGIDLLLDSFALARREVPSAQLVVVGGSTADVRQYRERSELLRLSGSVHFVGPQPVDRLAKCFASADVLVSPRITGGNTPMKIYSYLDSGRAVLATDLPTHTQVLTDEVAILRPAQPQPFADGLVRLLNDPSLRSRLAHSAKALVQTCYSYDVFQDTLKGLYASLENSHAAADGSGSRR
jgi:glycosyltransferase involved in cell wall biosynthesis